MLKGEKGEYSEKIRLVFYPYQGVNRAARSEPILQTSHRSLDPGRFTAILGTCRRCLPAGVNNQRQTTVRGSRNTMQIWVDADACPKVIKDILFRAAERQRISLILVANKSLHTPPSKFIRTL